jgi:excisionase family DNA binding protein
MKYTTKEIAAKVGRTRQRITQLIHDGLIEAEKMGRDWVIDENQIQVINSLPDKRGKYPRRQKRALQPLST